MSIRTGIQTERQGETRPSVAEDAGAADSFAPRKMTLAENVIGMIKVLTGLVLIGVALWGFDLWRTAK